MKTLRTKRPEDRLDYDVDFARWLAIGDTITDAAVAVEGGTVAIDDHDFTGQAVKVWLIGGQNGETVHVTVTITTAQGRTKEICFRVRVREGC